MPMLPGTVKATVGDILCGGCCGGVQVIVSPPSGTHDLHAYFERMVGDREIARQGVERLARETADPRYTHLSPADQLMLRGFAFKDTLASKVKELAPMLIEAAKQKLQKQLHAASTPAPREGSAAPARLHRKFSYERIAAVVELGVGVDPASAAAVAAQLPDALARYGEDGTDQTALLKVAAMIAGSSGSLKVDRTTIAAGGGGAAAP